MITFANLAGFWALLGIPAVLAIHFLQSQSKVVTVSTLFLLEALDRESVQGRKLDRLRNSIPLWLQLLAVLLVTWVLVQPRWVLEHSVQKVALVLDSSASMRAFLEPLQSALRRKIPPLRRGAKTMELTLLDSHLHGKPIYNGTSLDEMIEALDEWTPCRPAHDSGPALRIGRSLAGNSGILLLVTDHQIEQPGYGAKVLSVGEPFANVGFAGSRVEASSGETIWEVIVKNYGLEKQSRTWTLQSGSQSTAPRKLDLRAGETRILRGRFPGESNRITLHLETDGFDQDDRVPIVIPRPKELTVFKEVPPRLDKLATAMIASFRHTVPPKSDSQAKPDFFITSYNPLAPVEPEPVSLVLLDQGAVERHFLKGPVVSVNHSLVKGLNWQGLIARSAPGFPVDRTDTVLLWQGERALVLLRESGERRQLIFNFDVLSSNAAELPSFIVLAHRFVESIRERKVALEHANFELNQKINTAFHRGEEAAPLELIAGLAADRLQVRTKGVMVTPGEPGFFEIRQGEESLLLGSAQFADTREADFSNAATYDNLAETALSIAEEHTKKDDAWQVWMLLLLGVILLSWYLINRKTPQVEAGLSSDKSTKG